MKIAFAVLHLGRQGMEVVVEQPGPVPRRRLVSVQWQTKDSTDMPPTDWAAIAKAEIEFQDSNRTPFIR